MSLLATSTRSSSTWTGRCCTRTIRAGLRGAHPIPGAAETVERVRAERPPRALLHERHRPPAGAVRGRHPRARIRDRRRGVHEPGGRRRSLDRASPPRQDRCSCWAGPGVVAPLRDLGIETIGAAEPALADIVLVGWDDVLTYAALRAACESIWAGAPLLATSTASVFSVNGGAAPGWSGAIAAGIRQTTGARALTLGKPSPVALREACRALGVKPARTLVVGDDLELEIAMARRTGARSALVLTGVGTRSRRRRRARRRAGRTPSSPTSRHSRSNSLTAGTAGSGSGSRPARAHEGMGEPKAERQGDGDVRCREVQTGDA